MTASKSENLVFLEQYKPKALRFSAFIISLLLGSALVWAYYTKIEEVSIAMGEVVPKEQVKVIQHLEGGIIQEILIREGDKVKQGQSLYRLSLGVRKINRKEKIAELDGLNLTKARLLAQLNHQLSPPLNHNPPKYPPLAAKRHYNLLLTEQAAYRSTMAEQEQALVVAEKKIENKRLLVKELEIKRITAKQDLKLQEQQYKISSDLFKSGLTSESEHLDEKSKQILLKGKINVLNYSIPRAKSELIEAQEDKKYLSIQFNNKMTAKLSDIEQRIARLTELLNKAEEQNKRTEIISPINGIVKKMRYNTIHGVIKPGESIVEIVPLSNDLIIEAKLNPIDRGYVRLNQKAMVKISTYDFTRYGGLEGKVSRIGADSQSDPATGQSFFDVDITIPKNYLGDNPNLLKISPGMETTVDIHTGNRTVLEYLLKPVLIIKNEAFRER